MNKLLLLLNRDYKEKISNIKSAKSILSTVFSFVFVALFLGIFIYVYYNLSVMFLNIKLNGEINILERSRQLLSITYLFIIIVNVFFAVKNIYDQLITKNDLQILITLPLKNKDIILYKSFKVIANQLLTSFVTILPLNICFMIVSNQGFGFILLTIISILLVTLLSLGISMLLVIPVYYCAKVIKSHPVVMTIFYTLVIVVGFVIYSVFLRALKSLISTGNIKYFFNEANMKTIAKIANIFPFNNLASFTLNINGFVNFIFVLLTVCALVVLSLFILSKIFSNIVFDNHENKGKTHKKVKNPKPLKPFVSLLKKEFLLTLRTPGYTFQCFAICFAMPFLTFITISLIQSLVHSILYINLNFEFCVFILMFYVVIINTYAQSNISRDGEMFTMNKIMPIKYKDLILSKVTFCSIVSTLAILLSIILLIFFGYLNIFKAVILFILIFLFSEASILLATKHDLKHFSLKEHTNNSNNTLIITLFFSLILSVIVLLMGFIAELKQLYLLGNVFSIVVLFVSIITFFIISYIYMFKNLDKTFENKEDA
ncbi:MAG: hypothetical protein E7359_04195 [Clostridiales bacterium]|nr:hypothetical protein [Clostridiales bacterium]